MSSSEAGAESNSLKVTVKARDAGFGATPSSASRETTGTETAVSAVNVTPASFDSPRR